MLDTRIQEKPVLEINNIKQYYYKNEKQILADGTKRRNTEIKAVDDITLHLQPGEILGILGETGCGKSTLGRVLTGLEKPIHGEVLLQGENLFDILKRDKKELRRKVQMIFQNPFDVFDSRFRIGKVLKGTLALHNIGTSDAERHRMAVKALEDSGLRPGEDYMKRYPSELSGGQLQRISIIRSMLLDPIFIVADEPVSMLDISVRADIINMLRRVANEQKTSVIFISHDIATTRYIADRIAVMYLGQILEIGYTKDIMENPKHPYTRALISNCPSVDPRVPFEPIALKGAPPSASEIPPGCHFSPRCASAKADCHIHDRELYPCEEEGHFVRCKSNLSEITLRRKQ